MDEWDQWMAMSLSDRWVAMSVKSLEAAGSIFHIDPRASVSRYYYAAYQAMTGLLMYANPGAAAPNGREAWNHPDTQELIVTNVAEKILNRDKRNNLRDRLGILYKVRVSADYISADNVATKLDKVRKDSEFLVKVAVGVTNAGTTRGRN